MKIKFGLYVPFKILHKAVLDNFNTYSQYYEALYRDKDYQTEAEYVIRLIRTHHSSAKSLIELGCGTGKHAAVFCQNGYSVTGLERSSGMVNIAVQKNIKGFQPIVADIASYSLDKKFDVAISLFHVVSYLVANESLLSCFETTHRHLEPGGIFLFDVWYSPAVYFLKPETRIKRLSTNDLNIIRLAEPIIDYNKNVVDVQYEIITTEKHTGHSEVFAETHPMRHFSWPEIELLALKTGYSLLHAEEFGTGKKPGPDTWGVCFILKKNL